MPKQISYLYIGMASIVVVIAPDSTLSFKFSHLQGMFKTAIKKTCLTNQQKFQPSRVNP